MLFFYLPLILFEAMLSSPKQNLRPGQSTTFI